MPHTSLSTSLLIFCIICSLCSTKKEYDYYDILGVKRDASQHDIKAAYKNSPRKYDLTKVYEVLNDELKRKIYDEYGEDGLNKQNEEDDEYYYKILGLKAGATQKEIKQAYRRLSILFHPDKAGNSEAVKPQFMKITKAYEMLHKGHKRANYDLGMDAGFRQAFGSAQQQNNKRPMGRAERRKQRRGDRQQRRRERSSRRKHTNVNNIGFSVGGAKDINNFRDSIENNFVPLQSSITYEGIFYDYYFDTGSTGNDTEQKCTELFCPTYSSAVVNPAHINSEESGYEYYLSVGFNSGIKEDDFQRKSLNLVIVIDISGSMSMQMKDGCEGLQGGSCTNLNVVKEAIVGLFKHLDDQDRIGVVTFNHESNVINKLDIIKDLDMDSVSKQIRKLREGGSTNMEAGYKQGTMLYSDAEIGLNDVKYENRIIFLTDAMPNTGMINKKYLLSLTKDNADKRIYTSFIGIGVDFNSDLIETITKIRGGNYYSVHSYKEFMKRMDNEFEFMVTPLVFDMSLSLKSTRNMYTIDKIYGSADSDVSTGDIMKINTLFPSPPNDDGEIKGGITLLKLKLNKTNSNNDKDIAKLKLLVNYEDRDGEKHENFVSVIFTPLNTDNGIFDNNGIRKGILLSQYVSIIKEWIEVESKDMDSVNWNVQHKPMHVSPEFKDKFAKFLLYFQKEMKEIGDDTLQKEVDILEKLAGKEKPNKIEL